MATTLKLLSNADAIRPNDWIRPLQRSADFCSHSDTWMPSSTYGGGPLDHLLWAPVWLVLGACWWGKRIDVYKKHMKEFGREIEIVSGKIPKEHQLNIAQWEHRHPLYHEKFLRLKKKLMKEVMPFGKHKGRTLEKMFHFDRQYLEWFAANVQHPLAEKIKIVLEDRDSRVFYHPEYRKYPK